MDYLPIFAAVRGHDCLVVGGGTLALRKVRLLQGAGASVRVVAPRIEAPLRELADEHLRLFERAYHERDLDGARLVIAATDLRAVNAQVASDAAARGVLVNVVDDRELSSFIVPSIVDRSPLVAAVSSSGASPVLARALRGEIERLLSPAHGELARFAERHRERVRQRFPELSARRAFWEDLLLGRVGELVLEGRPAEAERELEHALAEQRAPSGEVCILACGSGEPDLMSLRAARLLGRADVVLYEQGLEAVVSLSRRDAAVDLLEPAPAGTEPAPALLERVAELAREGARVCLLRKGQPQPLAASAEAAALRAAGVPLRVL